MTRFRYGAAAMLGLAIAAAASAASEVELSDGPQWPNVALDEPRWPNVRLDDIEISRVNPNPGFLDPIEVEDRIMGRKPSVAAQTTAKPAEPANASLAKNDRNADMTGSTARWPAVPEQKPVSQFVVEGGARYWYSSGSMKFGFANGNPMFGNPTSTLDWRRLHAHSGEGFARVDHTPSGMFVKGVIGLGSINGGGQIDDRDFFLGQLSFSDTTSEVTGGNTKFGMIDIGWSYSPTPEIRLGFFGGYFYWNEKVTANGIVCNQSTLPFMASCPVAGAIPVDFNTPVFIYEPTWHAVRLGITGRYDIDQQWSVSGELVGIPYASLRNKDSHLLRQSMSDLGPAPNVISDSRYAYGVQTEIFVNYAVTPNIEISVGARYWGLASRDGGVRFGPTFAVGTQLKNYDHERYGVLFQVKGKL